MNELVPITFEQAKISDVDIFLSLDREVEDRKLYGPLLEQKAAIKEITENRLYFIKQGDTIVGTAAYRINDDSSVYISNVAVRPAYRRQGIARAAMLFLLGENKNTQCMRLVTHPDNENALRLYTSLSFVIEKRKENYFGDGEPRVELVRMQGPK